MSRSMRRQSHGPKAHGCLVRPDEFGSAGGLLLVVSAALRRAGATGAGVLPAVRDNVRACVPAGYGSGGAAGTSSVSGGPLNDLHVSA